MSTTSFSNDPGPAPRAAPGDQPGDSSGVKDQAHQTAGTAADEGRRVAGVAQDEVKNVTAEAQHQLRGLLDDARTQVEEQSRAQKTRLAETVRTFGEDVQSMMAQDERDGVAAQVLRQVSEQARGLASHLDGREPRELLDDARRFARRRPGAFLLGALAAGVVVGRVTRGAKDAQDGTGNATYVAAPTHRDVPLAPSGRDFASPTDPYEPGSDVPVTHPGAGTDPGHVQDQPGPGARGVEISESGLPGTRGGGGA